MSLLLCLVLTVSDGDTLKAQCDGRVKPIAVRLAEIDAPEIAHSGFAKMSAQPFGAEAKANLSALCLNQKVKIRTQAIDRYGRTVGTVLCQNMDASEAQAQAGLAWPLKPKKGSSIPTLVESAQKAKRGLWADSTAVSPAVWRRRASCSI